MVTIEGKPETKESKPAETKPESSSKEVEENQEPALKYKAWVLKVSIHCEGCKRKVEKILRKINGVYEVESDLKRQKVTVKASLHLDVGMLIKKLVKKGRHAELWPEKSEQKEKKGKSKNKDKDKDKQGGQANTEEGNNNNNSPVDDKDPKETLKVEVLSVLKDGASKSCENDDKDKQIPVSLVAGNQSPVPEKKSGGGGAESEGNGGGSGGGSKKKKKGQKGNACVNFDEGDHPAADAGTASIGPLFNGYGPHGPIPISVPMPSPANHSPPRQHHMDEYPTYYHAPPLYVTSYNTTYPSSGYGASYYASARPYSYMYTHSGHMTEQPSFHSYSSHSLQPSYSFELFSDENPNACSIM